MTAVAEGPDLYHIAELGVPRTGGEYCTRSALLKQAMLICWRGGEEMLKRRDTGGVDLCRCTVREGTCCRV